MRKQLSIINRNHLEQPF